MYLYIVTWTYTTFRTILYHPAVLYVTVTLVTCTHQTECKVLCELLLCRFRVLSGQAGRQSALQCREISDSAELKPLPPPPPPHMCPLSPSQTLLAH